MSVDCLQHEDLGPHDFGAFGGDAAGALTETARAWTAAHKDFEDYGLELLRL